MMDTMSIIRRALGYRQVRVIDTMEPGELSSLGAHYKITKAHYEWRRVRSWWRPRPRNHSHETWTYDPRTGELKVFDSSGDTLDLSQSHTDHAPSR